VVLDAILLGGVVLGFALLVLAHLALALKLTVARPHWRGIVALVVPPFAPLWGWRAGYTRWSWVWILAVVLYGAARVGAEIAR
jgi:hypothetical protein